MAYTLGSPADEESSERKSDGPMDVDEVRTKIGAILQDCITYVDSELSPARAKATDYYNGEPFGNEEEGRSQVVITEVRDVVRGVVPSLLRVVFGPEQVVEFVPKRADAAEGAAQATDYIQHCFVEENQGFLKTHSVLKDGLVRKLGVYKWYWEDTPPKAYSMLLAESKLQYLAASDEIELTKVEQKTAAKPSDDPNVPPTEATYEVDLVHSPHDGTVRVETVPGEEFLFDRNARDRDNCVIMAHRMEKTRGELLELGLDEELIEEWGHRDLSLEGNVERISRDESVGNVNAHQLPAGEANEKILYIESYVNLDVDGDGIAELRRVCTIGPSFHPANGDGGEPCDERPFAFFCPDPEPHTILGLSFADLVQDIQLVQSSLVRSTLDSLAASIFPRLAYVEGQASVADIMNTSIGAPLRMRNLNAVMPIEIPFKGAEALPIINMFNEISERRTGRSGGTIGLDADALQSSTKEAVGAAVQASQESTELLARIFAEMTLKPLFMGMYRLFVQHQPQARTVRLRGKWVDVDPAAWDADMDVTVNVALGGSSVLEKIQMLVDTAAKMEAIFTTYGPDNPLCTVAQYRNVLAKIAELRGEKDTTKFWKVVDPNWQPPQPAAPQPSPEQVIAQAQLQIEQMRTQKELEIKQAELQLKQAELQFKQQQSQADHEIQLRQMAMENELKLLQINAQFKSDTTEQQAQVEAEQNRLWLEGLRAENDQKLEAMKAAHSQMIEEHKATLAAQAQAHEQRLAETKLEHERQLGNHKAALAEAQAYAKASSDSAKSQQPAAPAAAAKPSKRKFLFKKHPDGSTMVEEQ